MSQLDDPSKKEQVQPAPEGAKPAPDTQTEDAMVDETRAALLSVPERKTPVERIEDVNKAHPEMSWLTGDVNATPEASVEAEGNVTLGERVFPGLEKKDLVEFNRTAVGILVLYWVLEDDYESFTACQKGDVKLTRESFKQLQDYARSILPDREAVEAMVTFMVINDLTKIKSVVSDIAERAGVHDVDHDKMLLIGLEQHPEISPSFQALSPHYQALILNGLRAKFNIGQFIQGENVPASLDGLTGIDEESLKFYLLHAVCDIAGAAGQFVQNGSVVMTEPTYRGFNHSISALEGLARGRSNDEVYDEFLNRKSQELALDVSVPSQRAVARICCMLRFSNPEQAAQVTEVFEELPNNVRAILESEINTNGTDDGYATLIYYSPALLTNLQKSMGGNESPEAFKNSLTVGLTTLARIYQEARIAVKKREGNGVFTVMASNVAKVASENPSELSESDIVFDRVGEDAEARLVKFSTVDADKFHKLTSLSEVPGKRIAIVGMGGGSDGVQAAMLSRLLERAGKECPCVISVRADKTGSQGVTGKVGEKRTIKNHGGEVSEGSQAYLVTPETIGSGRFLENITSSEVPTYLVIERDGDLTEQLKNVFDSVGGVDTVIGVDTGGDALYSTTGHDDAKATPDQDLRVLKAINDVDGVRTLSCEIAIGIDTPDNGEEVLRAAEAAYYEPTDEESGFVQSKYREWEMDGTNDARFGKTPLSWQQALQGKTGVQAINLPTRVVVDKKNPWKTFVNIQPSTKGMFLMETQKHLDAIQS